MKLRIRDYIKICEERGLIVNRKQLTNLVYKGKIRAKKIGLLWMIDEKDALSDRSFFLIEQVLSKKLSGRNK